MEEAFFKMGYSDGKTHLPLPTGPFAVGCVDLTTADREVLFRMFYPSREQNSNLWPKWLPNSRYAEGYVRFKLNIAYSIPLIGSIFAKLIRDPFCPITYGAPVMLPPLNHRVRDQRSLTSSLDGNHRQWPLVIFSHGMGSCRTTYSRLCSEIASRGYVIAAIEHLDGSASMSYKPDDDAWIGYNVLSPHERSNEDTTYSFRNNQLRKRVKECESVLKALRDGVQRLDNNNDVSLEWKTILDLKSPLISGHSFGGATAVTSLSNPNSPFVAGVAFDSWLFPLSKENVSIQSPKKILFINCEGFQGERNFLTMKKFETENNVWTLKKMNHYMHSDMLTVLGGSILKRLIGLGSNTETERGFRLSVLMFNAFIDSFRNDSFDDDSFQKLTEENRDFLIQKTDYMLLRSQNE